MQGCLLEKILFRNNGGGDDGGVTLKSMHFTLGLGTNV